jgi:hypothetical protein
MVDLLESVLDLFESEVDILRENGTKDRPGKDLIALPALPGEKRRKAHADLQSWIL